MKSSKYSLNEKKAKKILASFDEEVGRKNLKFNSRYVQPEDEYFKKIGDALNIKNKEPLL